MNEVRWYKGKIKVEILHRSKGNWLVKTLEEFSKWWPKGYEFTTVPRLLWRHPRK